MKTLFALGLLAVFGVCATAQTFTLSQTTLSAAVAKTDQQVCLTSSTGVVTPTTANPGTLLLANHEVMTVVATGNGTGCFVVDRHANADAHVAGELVTYGPPNHFARSDKTIRGTCTAANEYVLPVINTNTAESFDCKSGVWENGQQLNVPTVGESLRVVHGIISLNYAGSTSLGSLSTAGVRGLAEVSSNTTITSGYVYGTEGKLRVNGTLNGSAWVFGSIGQLDISNATLTAGSHVGAIWGDAGATGPSATVSFADLLVLTNTTATTFNSIIYAYGKAGYLMDLSNNGSAFIVDTAASTGWNKSLKIKINGVDYYIPLNPAAS
jgi:hypothetical protein